MSCMKQNRMQQNRMQMGARSYPHGMANCNQRMPMQSRDQMCGCNGTAHMDNMQRVTRDENCGCGQTEQQENRACSDMNEFCRAENGKASVEHVDHMGPTMGYVPWQRWEDIYDMEKGLYQGTIFCNLDKPFKGGRV